MFNKELVKKTTKRKPVVIHHVFDRLKDSVDFSTLVSKLILIEREHQSKYAQNHFIRRVIYDTICNGKWETIVRPAFVDNCTDTQMSDSMALAELMIKDRHLFLDLAKKSDRGRM